MTLRREVASERFASRIEHEVSGGNDSPANYEQFGIQYGRERRTTLAYPAAQFSKLPDAEFVSGKRKFRDERSGYCLRVAASGVKQGRGAFGVRDRLSASLASER